MEYNSETSVHADETVTDPVVAAFPGFGLAGLTAVDYLVDRLELDPIGHVSSRGLPSITPFTGGQPRHPTRLLTDEDTPITVLMGEQFVPVDAAEEVGASLLEWIERSGVDELCLLSGVPVAHGPEQHQTYWVATEDFQERRLADSDCPPMGNGFFDGIAATLVERGMEADLAVGVLVTPVHPQSPDAEAALRLLTTATDLYDVDVDPGPLAEFAAEVAQYYENLASRLEAVEEADRPEDRMYM